jgi:hypothetical protein
MDINPTNEEHIMARIATVIEITARVLAGLLAAVTIALLTSASPASAEPHTVRHAVTKVDPVKVCEKALVAAHRAHSGQAEDRAVVICSKRVVTRAQADRLYAWAYQPGHEWVLDIIG